VLASVGEGDRVVRPWPGFSGQSVGPDLALGFGLDRPGGVVVKRLFPGGPADRAGLQVGDVVLAVEGRPVDDVKALQFRIATGVAGGSVSLQVWRARRQLELTLPLEPAPESPPRDLRVLEGANPLAGAEVANLSPALAEELELGDQWEGVVVTRVLRGSPAAGLRLRTGDVIAKVNGRAISSTKDLASALRYRVSRWLLEIRREGQTLRLELAA
jgi:S1-C subfamily serine protease